MIIQVGAMEILWTLLVILLILKYWWSRRCLQKQLSVIPGPRPLPLIGNVLLFRKGPEEAFQTLLKLHSNYGDTVLLWVGGRAHIFVTNPHDVHIILYTLRTNNRDSHAMRLLEPYLGQGLLTSKGEYWKRQRNIINPIFSPNILQYFINSLNKPYQILVTKLSKYADGNVFNLDAILNLCIVDTIYVTFLGIQESAQNDDNHPFVKAIETALVVFLERFVKPWLMIDGLFRMTQLYVEQQKTIKFIHDFADDMVAEIINNHNIYKTETEGRKRKTFANFILSSAERRGVTLSPIELRDEMITLITASLETSNTTICYALMMLALYPDCQEQLFQELQQVFEQDANRPVLWEDLDKLQYLGRVIKETMRLYPVVSLLPRDIEEEVKLSNCTLPAGCTALVFTHVLHRNPLYFPDPEKFDPERFLPENVKKRHPYSYLPFGGGPRMCVGYKYAMMQMKLLLATVLRKYRLLPALTREELNRINISVITKPVVDFNIKMLPR